MSKIKPLARKNNIVIQEFGNEILIYDLKANKAYNLNETSALIWQLSNGDKTIAEIASDLSKKYNSAISEEFVWLALERLLKENLIENEDSLFSIFEFTSRREIIKKVGLGTVIAFPVISSLVAPIPANAASCFPITNNANENSNGCPCDTNNDCISTCCSGPATPRICITSRNPLYTVPRCGVCTVNCQCPAGDNCITMTGPDVCNVIGTPPNTPCIP